MVSALVPVDEKISSEPKTPRRRSTAVAPMATATTTINGTQARLRTVDIEVSLVLRFLSVRSFMRRSPLRMGSFGSVRHGFWHAGLLLHPAFSTQVITPRDCLVAQHAAGRRRGPRLLACPAPQLPGGAV